MIPSLDDKQREEMLKALADAFDFAATHAPTKEHAAMQIAGAIQSAGFWFHVVKNSKFEQPPQRDKNGR